MPSPAESTSVREWPPPQPTPVIVADGAQPLLAEAVAPTPVVLPAHGRFFTVPVDVARGIPALDGVRGLAAALVFLVHFQAAFGQLLMTRSARAMHAGEYLAAVGYHGVDVFFVLSGFLIYGLLIGRPTPLPQFFRRRVRRIYPTFLAVLTMYVVVGYLFPSRSKLPADGAVLHVLQNALLLPGVFQVEPIITVSWSLSFEVFFYLGLACLVVGLSLRSWARPARITLVVGCLAFWALGGPYVQHLAKNFVVFLPGILVYELGSVPRVGRMVRRIPGWVVWSVFLLTLGSVPLLRGEPALARGGMSVLRPATLSFGVLALGIGLLVLCASKVDSGVSRSLAARPLRAMGMVSYSFYLIHGLVTNVVALVFWHLVGDAPVLHGALVYAMLLPMVFIACTLGAVTLFHLVERPASL